MTPTGSASTVESLRRHLVGLKMPRALEILDHIIRQLERGEVSPLEALDALLAEEYTGREGRRVKAALQMARLTKVKTLADFDFSFQPSLDRNRILTLAQLEFIDHCWRERGSRPSGTGAGGAGGSNPYRLGLGAACGPGGPTRDASYTGTAGVRRRGLRPPRFVEGYQAFGRRGGGRAYAAGRRWARRLESNPPPNVAVEGLA
ncbi:ATP-binding protein [Caenispirillum bisanense]|uniref:IstB-like ATP binding protein n=1 Tax=Caenispirillum bisanense TaxID=414052 RepID=A0A286GP23_9PROT|nr:ATP-binding protein [Caenispirillum bisanense]SOD97295.1 IstB-like ATP binding protein [Caenispirillum bisanense]